MQVFPTTFSRGTFVNIHKSYERFFFQVTGVLQFFSLCAKDVWLLKIITFISEKKLTSILRCFLCWVKLHFSRSDFFLKTSVLGYILILPLLIKAVGAKLILVS